MPAPAIAINPSPSATPGFRWDNMSRIISPDRLITAEREAADRKRAEQQQNSPFIQGFNGHLRALWQAAYEAKVTHSTELGSVEDRLLRCLRQRLGQYDLDVYAEIQRQGRSDIYMLLTNIKCRAAQSWIEDVMLQPDEPIFDINPTPIPSLPQAEEIKIANQVALEAYTTMSQAAETGEPNPVSTMTVEKIQDRVLELKEKILNEKFERAKRSTRLQARKIEDELQEGGFYRELKKSINDLCTFPTAFFWGPIVRKERKVTWVDDGRGNYIAKIEPKLVRTYERLSPFDCFPSPSAKDIQDGYLFLRRKIRIGNLLKMVGVPGFDETAIRALAADPPPKEWLSGDTQISDAYSRDDWNDPQPTIDALEYWGPIQGKWLREWGMSNKQIPDPVAEYDVTAWICGTHIFMARLNPHPLGQRPGRAVSYEGVPDSIWGKCPPELMRDVQRIANAAARAVVDNLGIASGPQVDVNMDRLEPGEDAESLYPWKVWKTRSDPTGSTGPAVNFFQPSPLTDDLWRLFERAAIQAGEQTGIPAFTHAGQGASKEAGDTASGMSMQINQAGKVLKGVVREIDSQLVKPSIQDHWLSIMLYDDDEYKCGDAQVVCRASEHLIVAEVLQLRRTEYLNATNNPIDAQILGVKGRATLLRENAKALRLPVDDVVPPKDVIDAAMQSPPPGVSRVTPQPQPGAPRGAIQTERLTPAGGKHGEAIRIAA